MRLKLVEEGAGGYVNAQANEVEVGDLAAGEPAQQRTINVAPRYWEYPHRVPVWSYLSWVDDAGTHGEIKGSPVSF